METDTNDYPTSDPMDAWIKEKLFGPGGLKDIESRIGRRRTDQPVEHEAAAWILACLASPTDERARVMLEEILLDALISEAREKADAKMAEKGETDGGRET